MAESGRAPRYSVEHLLQVMSRLRDPETGCEWDLKQNYRSIAPSTIEEAYEVVDAIEREDYQHLREELGDLLFQVIFYSQLAVEEGRFSFDQVVSELATKLIRRHPHVFPAGTLNSRRDPAKPLDEGVITEAWEAIKKEERAAKGSTGVLDDIPVALPATTRAAKLQKRASRCGFDWPQLNDVIAQLKEEIEELEQAVGEDDKASIADEAGDVLFACINVVRHLKLDPESTLRGGNRKFERRFRYIEQQLAEQGLNPDSASVEQMEALWQEAKLTGL